MAKYTRLEVLADQGMRRQIAYVDPKDVGAVFPVVSDIPKLDEEGEPITIQVPRTDKDGEQVFDENDEPMTIGQIDLDKDVQMYEIQVLGQPLVMVEAEFAKLGIELEGTAING